MKFRRLWIALTLVLCISLSTLLFFGREIYMNAPPIPASVSTTEGEVVYSKLDIQNGQNVWQSMGGEEVGTIWGHGAYVAPDWTADWLHRESVYMLDSWGRRDFGNGYDALNVEQQAQLRARLQQEVRTNTYDRQTQTITVSPLRAEAIKAVAAHYEALFSADPALDDLIY
jgi:nitric oxide reductase subunit B